MTATPGALAKTSPGALDFDDLDLTGRQVYLHGVRFVAQAEGSTWDNPKPIERSIDSALLDGTFVEQDGYTNTEPTFQVWIYAPDSDALAYGEKLLFERCGRPAKLGRTPRDGFGARTIYRVLTSSLGRTFDRVLEANVVRSYTLRLVCYPFGFSEDEVVDMAVDVEADEVTVVIANGTSPAGWTSTDGPVTASAGMLFSATHLGPTKYSETTATYADHEVSVTYSFDEPVDFTETRYLFADMTLYQAYTVYPRAFVDDTTELRLITRTLLPSGLTQHVWACDDPAVSKVRFDVAGTSSVANGSGTPQVVLAIDNVQRTNQPPSTSSTGRQSLRLVEVTGSARTAGTMSVEHDTEGLGDVLLYTSKALDTGYNPDVTPNHQAGGNPVVADPATVSGTWISALGGAKFNVNARVTPVGTHLIMARLRGRGAPGSSGTVDATVTVRSIVNGLELESTELRTVTVPNASDADVELYPVGVVTLPLTDFPAQSTGQVQYEVDGDVEIDFLSSFHIGIGSDLTWVKAGDMNRLFLDAPSLDNEGRESLYLGTAADRSDAYHPGYPAAQSWGYHVATPPSLLMQVTTTRARYARVPVRHLPTWFAYAGR